jgi:hypothetical protein
MQLSLLRKQRAESKQVVFLNRGTACFCLIEKIRGIASQEKIIMLKLNASFSKKVPAEQEYSSKGYSASIEMELPEGLTPEQLQERIHETFAMVEASVDIEINGGTTGLQQYPSQPAPPLQHHQAQSAAPNRSRGASPKQIKYLTDIARDNHIQLAGYLQGYGLNNVEELNGKQCSALIDTIKAQAA